MMKYFLYARKSTESEDRQVLSIEVGRDVDKKHKKSFPCPCPGYPNRLSRAIV